MSEIPTKIGKSEFKDQNSVFRSFLQNDLISSFLPGGIAGLLSRTASAPFERIKVLYQVQGPGALSYNDGIAKTLIRIWKEEGPKGYFRGNGINCIRVFPYSAVQYATYQTLKGHLLKGTGSEDLTTDKKLLCGAIAGTSSVLATYPMDLVKTRLSIQTASLKNLTKSKVNAKISKPPGIFKSIVNIYKNEGGIKALYRGFFPTVMGVAPYTSLSFTIYENIKEFLPEEARQHLYTKLLIGGVSGAIAQCLIYPFDLLRRRFQVASMGNNEMGFKYTSITDAFRTIIRTEGPKGLYKGLTANLFKIVPQMAIQWASYELIRDYMKKE